MYFILSTCGTSILTNTFSEEAKKLVNRYSNAAKAEDIPMDDLSTLSEEISRAQSVFLQSTIDEASRYSAELAALSLFYKKEYSTGTSDIHYLLATDTWLGSITADLIRKWLEQQGIHVQVHRHPDLQTLDLPRFKSSLSDLIKWCHDIIEPCRASHRIAFNLSGGFKSETGFLQVLGMFHADEVFYTFERTNELMRIPRLPVKMDDSAWIMEDLSDIRRSTLNLTVAEKEEGIYWLTMDGYSTLTPWGLMVFTAQKSALYQKELFPSPSPKVLFAATFIPSCKGEEPSKIEEINKTIDLLCLRQESEGNPNLRSLDLKKLKNTHKGSTWECDAWHNGSAKRLFCRIEGDTIIIDRVDVALH